MPELFVSDPKNKEEDKRNNKSTHRIPPESERKKMYGHSHSPLSAYCYYPDKVNFLNKDKEEFIVLLLRRHPITNLPWVITAIVMAVSPLILSVFPLFDFLPASFQLVGAMLWYLIVMAFVLEEFLTWYFNVDIVTDERIFDVDFHNLLYREITDANLDQIQDVTVRMGSLFRTVFNYGDVLIQTAGEVPKIEFEAVPHPDHVAKILRDLRVEEEEEKLEGRVR